MKRTTEEFIEKANKKYNGKYDYSKVEYKNKTTKVCIICPTHGEFWQIPDNHLRGHQCPICAKAEMAKRIREESKVKFIKKSKIIFEDKYDYSSVNYVNCTTKVCIICPQHGEFWQTPDAHLHGCGCQICKNEKKKHPLYTNNKFIERAKKIHNNKYDYSKTDYKGNNGKICIICPTHGEFWQIASYHLQGQGCSKCSKNYRYTNNEFIERANEIHQNTYDYSKVQYVNSHTLIDIICPKHGLFSQTPNAHLNGQGCPICKESRLEKMIRIFLSQKDIDYIQQKKFEWLGRQSLDFYLPKYNIAIECQGIQHFKSGCWKQDDDILNQQQERDKIKRELCQKNNIRLIYFLDKGYISFLNKDDEYITDINDFNKIFI